MTGDIIPEISYILDEAYVVNKAFDLIEIKDLKGNILLPLSKKINNIEQYLDQFYLIERDKKYGIFNGESIIFDCKYDKIEKWTDKISIGSILKVKEEYGDEKELIYKLLSLDFSNVSECEYTSISPLENGESIAIRDNIKGKLNEKGQEICDLLTPVNDHIIIGRIFGKFGLIDEKGTEIIPFEYLDMQRYNQNALLVTSTVKEGYYLKDKKWLFDLSGGKIVDYYFEGITNIDDKFHIIRNNSIVILLDENYKEIVGKDRSYSSIRKWSSDKFIAEKNTGTYPYYNKKYLIIDKKGEIVNSREYDEIGDLINERAQVKLGGYTATIDSVGKEYPEVINQGEWTINKLFWKYSISKGDEIFISDLTLAEFFGNHLIKIKKRSNYRTPDPISLFSLKDGKELPGVYIEISPFNNGLAKVKNINKLEGEINEYGEELYDYVEILEKNLISRKKFARYEVIKGMKLILSNVGKVKLWLPSKLHVHLDGRKWRIFDVISEEYIGETYDSISDYENGKAEIVLGNKKGFIDENANPILEVFENLGEHLVVKQEYLGDYSIIYKDEEILSKVKDVKYWNNKKLRIKRDDRLWWIYDIDKRSFIGNGFNEIEELNSGKAKVILNNQVGYVNEEGEPISEIDKFYGNLRKSKIYGKWKIYDKENKDILGGSYNEIGTYKGQFIKFDYRDFRLLKGKAENSISVEGSFVYQTEKNLIYNVGGHHVRISLASLSLNGGTINDYINNHSKMEIEISYIDFKRQKVFGKPLNKE